MKCIARQRRRAMNTPGVNNRPEAREATDSWHHCLPLLRNIYRESSAVHSSSLSARSVAARPRAVAPRNQGNSEAGRTAFRVARHTERLPNMGSGLPGLPATRFLHIHIDLVGPLPTSAGYTYCLTAVDRFTRWPKAIPILGITAKTVARARFGCPQTVTTDQGRQFESQLFRSLAKLCGIQLSRTTIHHPAADGLTQSSHHVPRRPTLDRGASPGSPRCPHSIQNGPASVSSRAHLR
jgi:hypothetical protein